MQNNLLVPIFHQKKKGARETRGRGGRRKNAPQEHLSFSIHQTMVGERGRGKWGGKGEEKLSTTTRSVFFPEALKKGKRPNNIIFLSG